MKGIRQNKTEILYGKFTNNFEWLEIFDWFKKSSHVMNVFQKDCKIYLFLFKFYWLDLFFNIFRYKKINFLKMTIVVGINPNGWYNAKKLDSSLEKFRVLKYSISQVSNELFNFVIKRIEFQIYWLIFTWTMLFQLHINWFEDFQSIVDNFGICLFEIFLTYSQYVQSKICECTAL